jgi:hypothetical protein
MSQLKLRDKGNSIERKKKNYKTQFLINPVFKDKFEKRN